MTPIFNTSQGNSKTHIWYQFGDFQIHHVRYCVDKPSFLEFLVEKAKITLKVEVNDLLFSISNKSIPGCTFVAYLLIPAQICDDLSREQSKLPSILCQNGPWRTLKIKVNDLRFQCQSRVYHDACLMHDIDRLVQERIQCVRKGVTCFLH